jgi:hypothetical protein
MSIPRKGIGWFPGPAEIAAIPTFDARTRHMAAPGHSSLVAITPPSWP